MKNYVLAGVVVVATVLGVSYVGKPNVSVTTPTPVVNVSVPEQKTPVVNVQAPNVSVPAPIVNVPKQVQFGAVSGPDTYFPYVANNNSRVWTVRSTFTAATTTPCSLRAPAATTTLIFAGWQITTGTSTAATIDLGTSTTAFSTTTNKVAAKSIAANAQGYAVWTPAGGGVDDNKMAPNEYVVVKTAGAGLSGYTYQGTCTAEFREF